VSKGRDSGLFVFNIKASPHLAVSRRPAAPRTIPHAVLRKPVGS
jgi:hypothetical protein